MSAYRVLHEGNIDELAKQFGRTSDELRDMHRQAIVTDSTYIFWYDGQLNHSLRISNEVPFHEALQMVGLE